MSSGGLVTVLLQPIDCILQLLCFKHKPSERCSYSLRVLKSLHEIFRAPFLIIVKHCQSSSPAWRNSQQKHSRETCFQKHFLQVTTVCGLPKQVQAQLGPSPTQARSCFLPLLHNYLPVSNLPSTTNFTTPLLHTTTQGSRTSNVRNSKRVGKTTCNSQQNCKNNQRLSRSFTKRDCVEAFRVV